MCIVLCWVVLKEVCFGRCRLISNLGWFELGKNCCGISVKVVREVMKSIVVVIIMWFWKVMY